MPKRITCLLLLLGLATLSTRAAAEARRGTLDLGADLGVGVHRPVRGIAGLHFGGFLTDNLRLGVTADIHVGDTPSTDIIGLSFGFGGTVHYYFDLSGTRLSPFLGAGAGYRYLFGEDFNLHEIDVTITEAGVSIALGRTGRVLYEPRASLHLVRGSGENAWDVRILPASFSFRFLK